MGKLRNDLTGKRFGKLTIVCRAENRSNRVRYRCICDCGNQKTIDAGDLQKERKIPWSCGCAARELLIGKKFNRLVVIEQAGTNKQKERLWKCQCICGKTKTVSSRNLTSKQVQSCGCLQKEAAAKNGRITSHLRMLPDNEAAFRVVYRGYKKHAKERNLEFHLTKEDFKSLTEKSCYYCGAKGANKSTTYSGSEYTYNGVDRVDNSKGYILENCVPCCRTCNRAKLDMSVEEFLGWILNVACVSLS